MRHLCLTLITALAACREAPAKANNFAPNRLSSPEKTAPVSAGFVVNSSTTPASTAVSLAIGGSLVGLAAGRSIVLENAAGEELRLTKNGPFSFSTGAMGGASYDLRIKTNPEGQSCRVQKAIDLVAGADTVGVAVSCRAVQVW